MSDRDQLRGLGETPESIATLYSALQQLTIHSQENKSFTLYNFLLFNSFLLVAWATVFSQERSSVDAVASTFLCIVGILATFVWEPLGRDYAGASDLFRTELVKAEDFLPTLWPRVSTLREKQLDDKKKRSWWPYSETRAGLRDLLINTPRALALLYAALIILSWAKL